jgi:uncharacterized membrane protein
LNRWKTRPMSKTALMATLSDLSDRAAAEAETYSGTLGSLKALILEYFGPNGLIAAYVLLAVLALVVVWRLAKIGFDAIKYCVLPGIVLAALAHFVLGYSFGVVLPVTITASSLFLLFKG